MDMEVAVPEAGHENRNFREDDRFVSTWDGGFMSHPGNLVAFYDDGTVINGLATARNQQSGRYTKDIRPVLRWFSEYETCRLALPLLSYSHVEYAVMRRNRMTIANMKGRVNL